MTPGLHEALAYLESLRAGDPEPIADIPDGDVADDTLYALADQEDVKPRPRHSPDELLNALAIMRLCHAAEQAGPDLMSPGPGLLSVLVIPSAKDRDRVARRYPDLWRRMSVALPALVIDDTLGRSAAAIGTDSCPRLYGRVTGHPRLREGARIYTSPYFQVDPEAGWARTWSRIYKLGRYDRRFLAEMVMDRVVGPTEPIEL